MKTRKLLSILLTVGMTLSLTAALYRDALAYPDGYGSADEPYLISSAEDLLDMRTWVNAGKIDDQFFVLTQDIDLSAYCSEELEQNWTPIGTEEYPFTGDLDGRGHTISGLYIRSDTEEQTGLFGVVAGTVHDLNVSGVNCGAAKVGGITGVLRGGSIENCSFSGDLSTGSSNGDSIGGIAGFVSDGTVINCTASGGVSTKNNCCGGIVGVLEGGEISLCGNSAVISGFDSVGGIVGAVRSGTVSDCENDGEIYVRGNSGGGLCGVSDGTVSRCINRGRVFSDGARYGGIVGEASGTISDCLNYGDVSDAGGIRCVGGIAGEMTRGAILRCNNYDALERGTYMGGICGKANGVSMVDCANYGALSGFKMYHGGIVGYGESTAITGCFNAAAVSAELPEGVDVLYGDSVVGGIAGFLYEGNVLKCCNIGAITAQEKVGGICGACLDTNISYSRNDGSVKAKEHFDAIWNTDQPTNFRAGGIVGSYQDCNIKFFPHQTGHKYNPRAMISECLNTGNVSGFSEVGGITGYLEESGRIFKNINLGRVEAEHYHPVIKEIYIDPELNMYTLGILGMDLLDYTTDYYYGGTIIGRTKTKNLQNLLANYYYSYSGHPWGIGEYFDYESQQITGLIRDQLAVKENYDVSAYSIDSVSYLTQYDFDHIWEMTDEGPRLRKSMLYSELKDGVLNINNVVDLIRFRDRVNSGWDCSGVTVLLCADIDLSSIDSWIPIGYDPDYSDYTSDSFPFSGVFDGNGHTISGMTVRDFSGAGGLFSVVYTGTVRNLEVKGSVTATNGFTGGIIGMLNYGTVERCMFEGTVTGVGSAGNIGGIVGRLTGNGTGSGSGGQISECAVSGTVSGYMNVGGIVGAVLYGRVENCLHTGDVLSPNAHGGTGGIVGCSSDGPFIKNCCHFTGRVSGTQDTGGILGCATGTSSGYSRIYTSIGNCYYLTGTVYRSGSREDTGIGGPEGNGNDEGRVGCLTAEAFRTAASFTGWDFKNVWTMSGERPALRGVDGSKTKYSIVPVLLPMPGAGTIETSASSAPAGERITITVSSAAGFNLNALTVTDAEGNQISRWYKDSMQVDGNTYGIYEFEMPTSNVTVTAKNLPTWRLFGMGTENCPVEIHGQEDWDYLAYYVSCGGSTAGIYFRMMGDVYTGSPLGTEDSPFSGVFDGSGNTLTFYSLDSSVDCLAPFCNISGATIRNLRVLGTVSGGRHSSGLVGAVRGGPNLIENCEVKTSVSMYNDEQQREYIGGIVGHGGTYETTISLCVFNGHLSPDTKNAASFWGWSDSGATVHLDRCICINSNHRPIGLGSISEESTVEHTYYTGSSSGGTWAEEYSGKQAYRILPGEKVSARIISPAGAQYEGVLYAAAGEEVKLHLSCIINDESDAEKLAGLDMDGFFALPGTLVRDGDDYILTMPAADAAIEPHLRSTGDDPAHGLSGSGVYRDPWLITSAEDWDALVRFVNTGLGDTAGAFFALTEDITVTGMLGTLQVPFAGVFDGGGHKMTLEIDSEENVVAPFRYINGATIKDLRTGGTVCGNEWVSGLVGKALGGPNRIQGCEVGTLIRSRDSSAVIKAGGLLANGGSCRTTVADCVFTGDFYQFREIMMQPNWMKSYGFAFWGGADSGAVPILENCLCMTANGAGAGDVRPYIYKNIYYARNDAVTVGWDQTGRVGRHGFTVAGDEGVEVSLAGTVGMAFGGIIYAASGETLELELSYSGVIEPCMAVRGYEAEGGILTEKDGVCLLTVPTNDVTISPIMGIGCSFAFGGSGVPTSVTVKNDAQNEMEFTVAVSLSDESGRLLDVDVFALTVPAGESMAHAFELERKYKNGCVIKAFLLREQMAPLLEALEYTVSDCQPGS